MRATWEHEKGEFNLSPLGEILRTGLLRPFEIERLNDEIWPEEAWGTELRIWRRENPMGWDIIGQASDRLKGLTN